MNFSDLYDLYLRDKLIAKEFLIKIIVQKFIFEISVTKIQNAEHMFSDVRVLRLARSSYTSDHTHVS